MAKHDEIKEITSFSNPLVKEVANLHLKKYRQNLILIEVVTTVTFREVFK